MGDPSLQPLTPAALLTAVAILSKRDPRLAGIVDRDGPPPLWDRPQGFATLARIILEQQVSLASAAALFGRLEQALHGSVTPAGVIDLGDAGLRDLGITRQKRAYLVVLADRVRSGALSLPSLAGMPDDDAIRVLTGVPGIGPWTASIYLLMAMGRPDVWPPGDLALHKALSRVYRRNEVLSTEDAVAMAESWRPWRGVAARILWHGYLSDSDRARAAAATRRR